LPAPAGAVEPPFVDQHCHSILRTWASPADSGWRGCFTEGRLRQSLERDVPASSGYREFLIAFARWVGSPADEGSALAARQSALRDDGSAYLRRLLDDAGVAALLVDTGFGGDAYIAPAELAEVVGRPVRTIGRLEPLLESVLRGDLRPRSLIDEIDMRLREALDTGVVGFKSAAAYRCGLALRRPSAANLMLALEDRLGQSRRVTDVTLISAAVWTAAELGAERGVPLQFHTGFGDSDLHLPDADPTLLRDLFRDERAEGCPIVLLHCYPFVSQAAYLASVYPQVHVDLSLAIPLLGAMAGRRAIADALALCPWTKLLAASDGHSYPEMHWRGALLWRESLADVFATELLAERMDAAHASVVSAGILGANARRLFDLTSASTSMPA